MSRPRTTALVAACVAGVLALPPHGAASTRSQLLYAKGLIPFAQGRFEQANRFFEEALNADPQDALAAYYRGLAAARLGYWNNAVADMARAAELRPDLPGVALDLGIIYYETQQYDEAEPWLRRAHQDPSTHFAAALFLGLSRFRNADDAGALELLGDAAKDPAVRATALYYGALALLRQGREEEARQQFSALAAEAAESEVGQVAERYLQHRPRGALAAPVTERLEEGRWSGGVEAGFQYDSNVILAPSDSAVRKSRSIESKDDARVTIDAGARYKVFEGKRLDILAAYDFHQSVHFSLTEFDLQGHRLRLDLQGPPGRYQLGVSGWYDFYALDYRSYFQEGGTSPWITFFEGASAATQLYYRVRARDYLHAPFEPYLDAFNNAFGARQFLLLEPIGGKASFGYQFDLENPFSDDGDDFRYKGHQLDLELSAAVLDWFALGAGYAFRLESYDEPNSRSGTQAHPGDTKEREDQTHRFVLRLERSIGTSWLVNLTYVGVLNDSNLDPFEYGRNVVWGGVRYRF